MSASPAPAPPLPTNALQDVTCADLPDIVRILTAVQLDPALTSRQVLHLRWHLAACESCFDTARLFHDPDGTSTFCPDLLSLPLALAREPGNAATIAAGLPACSEEDLLDAANNIDDDELNDLRAHRDSCARCSRWAPIVARGFTPARTTSSTAPVAGDPALAPQFCSSPGEGAMVRSAVTSGLPLTENLHAHCDACAACWVERGGARSHASGDSSSTTAPRSAPITPLPRPAWRRFGPLLAVAALVLIALGLLLLRDPTPRSILLQGGRAPGVQEAARVLLAQPWPESVAQADPTLRTDLEALLALLDSSAPSVDRAWVKSLADRLAASELSGSELRVELEKLAGQR